VQLRFHAQDAETVSLLWKVTRSIKPKIFATTKDAGW
jgi:hypothetical protein